MQLFINTYGSYLHVKDEMFEIRIKKDNEIKKHHFSAKKVKGVILSPGVALSTDAVKLAMIHNVDIVFFDHYGNPVGRVWHSKLGSTTKIRKAQLQASLGKEGVKWIKEWVGEKITCQVNFINDLKKHRKTKAEYLEEKVAMMRNLHVSVSNLQADEMTHIAEQMRGLEGTASRIYFETLNKLLAPEYWFDGRSRRPAKDAFNAFLNYAYGILYSRIEKALIIAGLDPYIGFMHRDDYNQLSFVFDFIEPYRIFADRTVFRLFSGKKINQSHTDKITNGYSLNKFGKELLVQSFTNYIDEDTCRYKGRNQTRNNIIQLDAHVVANSLLNSEYPKNNFKIITIE